MTTNNTNIFHLGFVTRAEGGAEAGRKEGGMVAEGVAGYRLLLQICASSRLLYLSQTGSDTWNNGNTDAK